MYSGFPDSMNLQEKIIRLQGLASVIGEKEILDRLEAFSWGSPCERQEMVWVYETILRNAEDEEIKEGVRRLLRVMKRER